MPKWTFDNYLKKLLEEKERKPAWLARKIDRSDSTVSRWLNGKTRPRPPYKDLFTKITEALDLTLIEQQMLEAVLNHDQNLSLPLPPAVFVGRNTELSTLHHWITRESHVRIYGIVGEIGIGKTALAQQICRMAKTQLGKLPIVVQCEDCRPHKYLEQIAVQLDFTPHFGTTSLEYSKHLHDAMAFYDVLLVLEDVHMLSADDLRYVIPPLGTCPIVVTTNRLDWPPIQHTDVIHLQPFSPLDTIVFFANHIGIALVELNRNRLIHLADQVGYIPLVLKLFANFLVQEKQIVQQTPLSEQAKHIGNCLETLSSDIQQERFRERFGDSPAIQAVIRAIEDLPSDFRYLLDIAAVFNDDVDERILRTTSALGMHFDTALLRLVNHSYIRQTGLHTYKVSRLIKLLVQKSLKDKPSIWLMPVQFYIQSLPDAPVAQKTRGLIDWLYSCGCIHEAVDLSLELVGCLYTTNEHLENHEAQSLLTHALQIIGNRDPKRSARLYLQLGALHMQNMCLTASRICLEKGQKIAETPALRAAFSVHLGRIALYKNDFDAAAKKFREGLKIAQNHEIHELNCYASANLGLLSACEGKYPYAQACYKSALHIAYDLKLTQEKVSILSKYGNLLCNQHDFDQGFQRLHHALQIAQEHGYLKRSISPLSVLASAYIEVGNTAAARLYLHRALQIIRKLQQPHLNYLLYLVAQLEQDDLLFASVYLTENAENPLGSAELKDILLFY